jgi:CDGSH-type Zn-finger protein
VGTPALHPRSQLRAQAAQVFVPEARPWVVVDAADADAVATAIESCPTGALHYRRLDGGLQEQPPAETTVEPRPNGPLFVRGAVRIVDPDGDLIREDTRVALCRCGASENKPFCDGSHRRVGFTAGRPRKAGALPAELALLVRSA